MNSYTQRGAEGLGGETMPAPVSIPSGLLEHAGVMAPDVSSASLLEQAALPQLSPREIANYTFETFRHSQGMVIGQKHLVRLGYRYWHDQLTPENIRASYPLLEDRAMKFTNSARGHTTNTDAVAQRFKRDINSSNEAWEAIMANTRDTGLFDKESALALGAGVLLRFNVMQDYRFIVMQEGRKRGRPDDTENATPASAHLSHIVYYGMLGRSTGVEPFDRGYALAMDELLDNDDSELTLNRLTPQEHITTYGAAVRTLAATHFTHYPKDRDELPEKWQAYLQRA